MDQPKAKETIIGSVNLKRTGFILDRYQKNNRFRTTPDGDWQDLRAASIAFWKNPEGREKYIIVPQPKDGSISIFEIGSGTHVRSVPLEEFDTKNFPYPKICVDAKGNIYLAEKNVVVYSLQGGKPIRRFGPLRPSGIAVNQAGEVFVVLQRDCTVSVYSPEGDLLRSFGKKGNDDADFKSPGSIFLDEQRDLLYIVDKQNLQVFTTAGEWLREVVTPYFPQCVAIDDQGTVFVGMGKPHLSLYSPQGDKLGIIDVGIRGDSGSTETSVTGLAIGQGVVVVNDALGTLQFFL